MTAQGVQNAYAALLLAKHCLLLTLLIVCAYTDLLRGKVYNWCTYPAIGFGLALAFVLDGFHPGSCPYLVNSIFGLLLAAAVYALPYFRGWLGGGDMKLVVAVGAVAGAQTAGHLFIVYATLYAALMGAILGMAVLIWRGQFWVGLKNSLRVLVTFRRRRPGSPGQADVGSVADVTLPYGFAIASGTMLAWFVFLVDGLFTVPQLS